MENFILVLAWVFMVISFTFAVIGEISNSTDNTPIQIAIRGYRIIYHTGKHWLIGVICLCYLISYYFM